MADAELTAKLKLDASEFEKKLKSSTGAAADLAKRVGDSVGSLTDQQKALIKSAKDAGYFFDAQGRLRNQTGKYAKQNDALGQKLKSLQSELKNTGNDAELLVHGLQKAAAATQNIKLSNGTSFKIGAMAGAIGGAVGGVIGGVANGIASSIVNNVQSVIVGGIKRINSEAEKAATIIVDSSRLNLDTRTLQEWTYAAGKVNISAEKMADIFKDTNDKVGDFVRTGGGEAKDIFETLNLNVRELIGLSPDQVLMRIAKESEGLNAQDRTFLFEAIADEASALLPLLDNNAAKMKEFKDQAQREGRILSDGQLMAMKSYKESLDSLMSRAEAFAAQVAGNLAKPLEILTTEFGKLIDQYGGAEKAAKSFAVTVVEGAAMGIQALAELIKFMQETRVVWTGVTGAIADKRLEFAKENYEADVQGNKISKSLVSDEELAASKKHYEDMQAAAEANREANIRAMKAADETAGLIQEVNGFAKKWREDSTVAINTDTKSQDSKIIQGLQDTYKRLEEQYAKLISSSDSKSQEQAQQILLEMKQVSEKLKGFNVDAEKGKAPTNTEQIEAVKRLIESNQKQLAEMQAGNALHADQIAVQNRIIELQNKLVEIEAKSAEELKSNNQSLKDYDQQKSDAKAEKDAKETTKAEKERAKELAQQNRELLKKQDEQLRWKEKLDLADAKAQDEANKTDAKEREKANKQQSDSVQAFNESVKVFGSAVDKQSTDTNTPQVQYYAGGGRESTQPYQPVNAQYPAPNSSNQNNAYQKLLGTIMLTDGKSSGKLEVSKENIEIVERIISLYLSKKAASSS